MEKFNDINFKYIVVNALMEDHGLFTEEIMDLSSESADVEEGNLAPAVVKYVTELNLDKEVLDKITYLCFDGGNEIYQDLIISSHWIDDLVDVRSIQGIENLPNLEKIDFLSVFTDPLDFSPLLSLKKIKEITCYKDMYDGNSKTKQVFDQLIAKGVLIKWR